MRQLNDIFPKLSPETRWPFLRLRKSYNEVNRFSLNKTIVPFTLLLVISIAQILKEKSVQEKQCKCSELIL